MSGESDKIRNTMDLVRQRLTQGGMPAEQARKIAHDQAIKHDRREQDKRK